MISIDRMLDAAHPRHHPPAWVGDVIAALVIVSAAFAPFPASEFRPDSPLTLAVVLAPALVLPFRRRHPIIVLAVVIALFGVAAVSGILSPGVGIAAGIAMFGVTSRLPRRPSLIATGAAVLAVLPLSLLAAVGTVLDPRSFQFAIVVAFAAAAGDATRSRREFIVAVTERAERAEQSRESEARRRVSEERLRIARDLHDAVAHEIAVISLNAGVASSALESRPEKAREALGTIRSAARSVLAEIGDLMEMLRADDSSPARASAPQPGLDQIGELVGQFARTGLEATVRREGEPRQVTVAVDLVAYRVVQEALTNAHKHGSEHRAHVLIAWRAEALEIVVTNPVVSAPGVERAEPGSGHGLLGLRERVAAVRGTVSTGPAPGGYRLAASLPLAPEDAA